MIENYSTISSASILKLLSSTVSVDHKTCTIHLLVSDAQTTPTIPNTDPIYGEDGSCSFNQIETDGPTIKHWRYLCAYYVAIYLKLDLAVRWQLRWPKQCVLYTTWSMKPENTVQERRDTYLKDGPFVFRSPDEFVPHLLWLITYHASDDNLTCGCKYCSKRDQTTINDEYSLGDPNASPSMPAPGPQVSHIVRNAKRVEKNRKERRHDPLGRN
ncbi:hypothetical protein BKA62DRAFT_687788 [Auriculariales sp. MPI-PUGE-AT-0066]|nr:hypothetical protein BKA62DRAFT_687788 [Auriculariales sp. MPI-PUGE-AT-0066]